MSGENENQNQDLPATDKQKKYITDLLETVTRKQASEVITFLTSGEG